MAGDDERDEDPLADDDDEEEEELEADDSPEAVAARMRNKIRMQAAELLLKVDGKAAPSPAATTTATTPTFNTQNDSEVAAETNGNNKPTDLTARLQQLALQREQTKTTTTAMIQSDPSLQHLTTSTNTSFDDLKLPAHLLKAIYQMGFDRPSQIQAAALPRIIQGRNVIGQAQSGSGMYCCHRICVWLAFLFTHSSHVFSTTKVKLLHLPLACYIVWMYSLLQHNLFVLHPLVNLLFKLWNKQLVQWL